MLLMMIVDRIHPFKVLFMSDLKNKVKNMVHEFEEYFYLYRKMFLLHYFSSIFQIKTQKFYPQFLF